MAKNNIDDTTQVANEAPRDGDNSSKEAEISTIAEGSINGATSVDVPEELRLTKEEEEQLIKEASSFKQRGNELFKSAKYDAAREEYQKALDICPFSQTKDRAIFHANIGACYFKQSKWKESADACTAALKDDPEYIKALYRRAQANEKLGTWTALESSFKDYKELSSRPHPISMKTDIEKGTKTLPKRIADAQEREKAEMMGKLKDLGNTVLGKFGLSTDNFKMVQDPNTGGYSINFDQGRK